MFILILATVQLLGRSQLSRAEIVLGNPMPQTSTSGIRVVPPKLVGLGDDVTIHVPQLDELIKSASASGQQVILFLNGMPLKKLYMDGIDPSSKEVKFRLKRTEESKDVWNKLLGNPMIYWARPVAVSVGLESGLPLPSNAKIDLVIIKRVGLFFWEAMVIIIFWLLYKYGKQSAALRTFGADSPYSLAQVQMAAWFFLVISSYVFIWLVTGDMNNMPESVLILMGISIGTTLGARMIDQNKQNSVLSKVPEELVDIEAKIKECESLPDDAEAQKRKQGLEEQRTILKNKTEPKSQGFWDDIISDSYGTSLHRLQALVWTIVFGVIFCHKVYQNLAMPEFNSTLLALMGISSGTYLGFKVPEQRQN